ncbi:MAG: hypothetical protein KatS3mg108_1295 [Isosphaeraceae bacterium]|nr:MAG: hypothetical protein KatS3mg108_1295 [Isosphaeraceae bacterium]
MNRHTSHIEHFRGAKILRGEEVLIENLDGILSCREKSSHRREWHGYFETQQQIRLESGVHYKLVLNDGRSAEINAGEIRGVDPTGAKMHVVEFYVVGDLHYQGRPHRMGLDREAGARRSLRG